MNTKEKAQAYDEMVQRVKELYEAGNALTKKQMEIVLPELAESEDESIRKEIIAFLKSEKAFQTIDLPISERWIASLERQKETAPIPDKFSGLKSLMLQYLQSSANRKDDAEIEDDTDLYGRKILDYIWKYEEKQEEQKEQPGLPGIEESGVPGKDYIPIEWIDACEQYGKWKIVQQEQPEVDLEKEAVMFCFDNGINITPRQAKEIAHHFFNLGLNTRKEE